jgi:hypothetical protein
MPEEYPVSQLLSDMMSVIQEAMVYIVPAAILAGCAAFVVRWFMEAVYIGNWTFGRRK